MDKDKLYPQPRIDFDFLNPKPATLIKPKHPSIWGPRTSTDLAGHQNLTIKPVSNKWVYSPGTNPYPNCPSPGSAADTETPMERSLSIIHWNRSCRASNELPGFSIMGQPPAAIDVITSRMHLLPQVLLVTELLWQLSFCGRVDRDLGFGLHGTRHNTQS